ncbi:hypothetical protein BGZ47_000294 [Haplosporangium gracile]|nr:hypothetical protein BGZ47_000294 [Haplosporangium gracile]
MYFYGHLIWIGFVIFVSILVFIIRARRAAIASSAAASKPQSSVVVIEPASIPMHAYPAPVPAQFNHYQPQPQPHLHPQGFAPNPTLQFQQQQQQHPQQQQQFYPPLGQQTPYMQPQQTPFPQQQQTPFIQPQRTPFLQQQQQQQQVQPLQPNLQTAPFSPSILSPPPLYTAATSLSDAPYPALQPAPPVTLANGSTGASNAVNKGGFTPKPSDAITVDPSKPWQLSPYPSGDGNTAGTALEKDEEEGDIQVSWQDQENINTFSKYNAKLQDLEEEYESKKTEKEYLDDLAMELELADEDEPVKYRIGEAFVSLSLEAAQDRISKSQEELDQEIEGLKSQMDEAVEKMDGLKKTLYARFGNAINLEKD